MAQLVDLQRIPALSVAPEPEWITKVGATRALYFAAEPFNGAPTKVFAYIATPMQGAGPFPAIVLVHGGRGRAYANWATMWAQRGYVAMSLDLVGCGLDRGRHPFAGPPQDTVSMFEDLAYGVERTWLYHAVADVLHSVSLLSALPEVDTDRVAVTGISWGAHVAELALGLDPRPRAAAFVYGCGYMRGSPTCAALDGLPSELADLWIREFDPQNYIPRIDTPTLWITGTKDEFYPLDRFQQSHRLVPGARTVRVTPDFGHSHEDGWSPLEISEFVNSHLQAASPLPQLGDLVLRDGQVSAAVRSDLPIVRAELHYTSDRLDWSQRSWATTPGVIAANAVEATLPDVEVSAYLMTLEDVRGVVVSTDYVAA